MSNTFTFEIVSPEKISFSKDVASATIPGGEGEYGVLPGHAPMITTVKAGLIEVFAEGSTVPERFFVAGGFAEVTQNRCTVLAEEATPVADLNRVKLEEQAKEIAAKLAIAAETERALLHKQQEVIAAKIVLAA